MERITIENYEEYFVMHADGELQPHEEMALQEFLASHPHLISELEMYSQARLTPDTTEVFVLKESLIKPEPRKKVIAIANWRYYAVAAGIVVVILLAGIALRDTFSITDTIVHNNNAGSSPTVAPVNINGATHKDTALATTARKEDTTNNVLAPVATSQNSTNALQPGSVMTNQNNLHNHRGKGNRNFVPAATVKIADNEQEENIAAEIRAKLNRMPVGDFKPLPVAASEQSTLPLLTLEAPGLYDSTTVTKNSWLDKLPINEVKKEELSTVATAISKGIENVQTLKENIRDKSLTVRIQQRKVIFSF